MTTLDPVGMLYPSNCVLAKWLSTKTGRGKLMCLWIWVFLPDINLPSVDLSLSPELAPCIVGKTKRIAFGYLIFLKLHIISLHSYTTLQIWKPPSVYPPRDCHASLLHPCLVLQKTPSEVQTRAVHHKEALISLFLAATTGVYCSSWIPLF